MAGPARERLSRLWPRSCPKQEAGADRAAEAPQLPNFPSYSLIFHLTLFAHGPSEARTPRNLCSNSLPPLPSFLHEAHLAAHHQNLAFSINESPSLSCCLRSDRPSAQGDRRTKRSKETWAVVEGYSSKAPMQLALLGCPRTNYQVLSGQLSTSPKGRHCVAGLS